MLAPGEHISIPLEKPPWETVMLQACLSVFWECIVDTRGMPTPYRVNGMVFPLPPPPKLPPADKSAVDNFMRRKLNNYSTQT